MERYEKENLEQIIATSNSKSDVIRKLGLKTTSGNFDTLNFYIKKYGLNISNFKSTYINNFKRKKELSEILIKDSLFTNRTKLKDKLYKNGIKQRKCEICGQDENWNGHKMSLILDHINGNNTDHRIENLRIVCPNCNATLDTHCRGEKRRKKEKEKNVFSNKQIENFEKHRKVKRPSLNTLLEEVSEFGLEGTGRKYNVTGNSIKKWIRFYKKIEQSKDSGFGDNHGAR